MQADHFLERQQRKKCQRHRDQQRDGGDVSPANRRPEHRLVSVSPSELYTSYNFRSTLQFHLGMRGNASSPVTAKQVKANAALGEDGKGFDIKNPNAKAVEDHRTPSEILAASLDCERAVVGILEEMQKLVVEWTH